MTGSPSVADLLSWWPAWLAMTVAVLVALNQAITESQKFANFLGGWARKLHARARARNRMDIVEFTAAVRDAVAEERKRWEEDEARALLAVEGRLNYVTGITASQQTEMEALNFRIRCMTAYTEYEANWHHKLRMLLVKADMDGGKIPIGDLPDHVPYYEFEKLCQDHKTLNWRSWDKLG